MEKKLTKVGIIGVSGYSGFVALKLLLRHPHVRLTYISANSTTGPADEIWPQLKEQTRLICEKFNLKKAVSLCDLLILALPHTVSMSITPELLKAGKRVIDISGDYRLHPASVYEKWYGLAHKDNVGLGKAVYGLPEIFRTKIRNAKLITNPGCYPTAALLALAPLAGAFTNRIETIIIDAKSGVSGAGKKTEDSLMFCETHENFKAYKVLKHQHTPEIELYLSKISEKKFPVTFVPHLLPVNHGILETIYVSLNGKMSLVKLHALYKTFYKTEPFVRILSPGQQPELKHVVGTNYCDIGLALSEDHRMLVVTSVIDNLYKGAAGQAVQNLNILCGYDETTSLI